MSRESRPFLSVVVPVFNEARGLPEFHGALVGELAAFGKPYEIIYCNDGSADDTARVVSAFRAKNPSVKLLSFSRNFGKEIATTAGIHHANGEAVLTIDGDGQYPVELIPTFVERWRGGSHVVIGRRTRYRHESWSKRASSRLFYALFNRFTGVRLTPGATDFRLIDRRVQQDFIRMTERNRITRGLIDWLGYECDYVPFDAGRRLHGDAGYSLGKLTKLALDSVISLSHFPLYAVLYTGLVVLPLSVLLGIGMLTDAALGDPLNWNTTGSAYVVVLILFLIGIILASQGIIGVYLSHIHAETQNRPLYIVDTQKTEGVT